ncbi:MAG: YajQ family cyclic di-GMP-binding protein [Chitinophagaceae bacterium]
MPSFDIASKVDVQTLDNAINTVKKEISNRFDFKDSIVEIDLNKKDFIVTLTVESEMKMKQVIDVLISRAMKQGIDGNAFNFDKDAYPSGKTLKKEVPVRNGLQQDDAKKVVKLIKETGLKVQAQIMDDIVRVTGKKIDDLQEVIAKLRASDLKMPLQFVNMKS